MAESATRIEELRRAVYDQQQAVNALELQLAATGDPAALQELAGRLVAAHVEAGAAEQALAEAQKQAGRTDAPPAAGGEVARTRSLATTGLDVIVEPQMASVPTAYYHLLDAEAHPLVKCTVLIKSAAFKRVRITSYIEGYSAQAVDTVEVRRNVTPAPVVAQQPTLFADKVRTINELTRASLNVLAEDLDTGKIEVHKSMPIWLLARTAAPLATYDPTSGTWKDMSQYLGAFVTPNHPSVMEFLRIVAGKHGAGRLAGYQAADVDSQVQAIYEALKSEKQIAYVNSLTSFDPNTGAKSQRLRLPRESLADQQANCVDGAVLFASILEALSLNPALVVVPSHVLVGWETSPDSNQWRYLETTKLATGSFADAVKYGTGFAEAYAKQAAAQNDTRWFRRWPLRDLRSKYGIYPAE
jgi:hypothetical protein